MAFGEWLESQRIKRGLSQRELAIQCGLTPAGLNHFFQGNREPSLESLKKISEGLRVPLDEVKMAAGYVVTLPGITLDQALLLKNLEQLPGFVQEAFREMVSTMAVNMGQGEAQFIGDVEYQEKEQEKEARVECDEEKLERLKEQKTGEVGLTINPIT